MRKIIPDLAQPPLQSLRGLGRVLLEFIVHDTPHVLDEAEVGRLCRPFTSWARGDEIGDILLQPLVGFLGLVRGGAVVLEVSVFIIKARMHLLLGFVQDIQVLCCFDGASVKVIFFEFYVCSPKLCLH